MNKERLLKLADRLEKIPEVKFDLRDWIDDDINPDLVEKHTNEFGDVALEGFCGTVACVLGHAAFVPEFRELGLTANIYQGVVYCPDGIKHNAKTNLDAGMKFFDLSYQHAAVIFATMGGNGITPIFYGKPEYEVKPVDAANALRRYVETDGQFMEDCIGKSSEGS